MKSNLQNQFELKIFTESIESDLIVLHRRNKLSERSVTTIFNGAIAMYTLRKMKHIIIHSLILPSLLAITGLMGIYSSAQAACYGYPESIAGCKINGVWGACVGKRATGDIILVGASIFDFNYMGCKNAAKSPLAGTITCVVRGLRGNDVILASSSLYHSKMIICGGSGNDIIRGGYQNDVLLGEAGQDIIIGSYLTDQLYGGSENDTLLRGDALGGPNINYGGTGTRDVCQAGNAGINGSDCEVKLP